MPLSLLPAIREALMEIGLRDRPWPKELDWTERDLRDDADDESAAARDAQDATGCYE